MSEDKINDILAKFYATLDYAMSREQFVPYKKVRDEAKEAILQHFQQEQENDAVRKMAEVLRDAPIGDFNGALVSKDLYEYISGEKVFTQPEVDRLIREAKLEEINILGNTIDKQIFERTIQTDSLLDWLAKRHEELSKHKEQCWCGSTENPHVHAGEYPSNTTGVFKHKEDTQKSGEAE